MKFEQVMQHLEEYILENFGERCDEFVLNCMVCQQYLAMQILQNTLELEKTKGKGES